MKIELITTGSELLLGEVVNSHLSWIGAELAKLGLRLTRNVSVPDGPAIGEALQESLRRADLVITTGGLGPTSDDITREVASELLGLPLSPDPRILNHIEDFFRQRSARCPVGVDRQAMVPAGARVLDNPRGTAPGLIVERTPAERASQALVMLPGPPRELRPMWQDRVLPWLRVWAQGRTVLQVSRIWRIVGIGESRVQELIEASLREISPGAEIGYCSRPGEVDVRFTAASEEVLRQADRLVGQRFEDAVYATGDTTMEAVVIGLARASSVRLATAESCTGGLVAHRLTNVPGSSEVFTHGWVTYANAAKIAELGVPAEWLDHPGGPGAVSEETARAMAEGALASSGVDLAVSITGIAGPGGGSSEKPAGTVWMGIARRGKPSFAIRKLFPVDRETFKAMASQTALDLMRRSLIETSIVASH